jgi:ribosome production factor 1
MAVINSTSQIANKATRSKVSKSLKRDKAQAKLARRVQQKKAEASDPSLREARLKANVPRTIERTKEWLGDDVDDERMLPVKVEYPAQSEEAAEGAEPGLDNVHFDMGRLHDLFAPYMNEEVPPSAPTDEPPKPNQEPHPDQGNSVPEDPATQPGNQPRTLITTSPRPSEFTLAFVHELGGLFGGSRNCDVIPRKTKRFELTRVCRWACERGYASMVVIGEAHGGRNRSGPSTLHHISQVDPL